MTEIGLSKNEIVYTDKGKIKITEIPYTYKAFHITSTRQDLGEKDARPLGELIESKALENGQRQEKWKLDNGKFAIFTYAPGCEGHLDKRDVCCIYHEITSKIEERLPEGFCPNNGGLPAHRQSETTKTTQKKQEVAPVETRDEKPDVSTMDVGDIIAIGMLEEARRLQK